MVFPLWGNRGSIGSLIRITILMPLANSESHAGPWDRVPKSCVFVRAIVPEPPIQFLLEGRFLGLNIAHGVLNAALILISHDKEIEVPLVESAHPNQMRIVLLQIHALVLHVYVILFTHASMNFIFNYAQEFNSRFWVFKRPV